MLVRLKWHWLCSYRLVPWSNGIEFGAVYDRAPMLNSAEVEGVF